MRKVKISENSFKKLFDSPINEISYNKVDKASDMSDNIFYDMMVTFNDFYDTVIYNADTNNPYVKKILEHATAINDILIKKTNQRKNFDSELNKFDYKKFYADKNRPENEEDYDNIELRDLQNRYPKEI